MGSEQSAAGRPQSQQRPESASGARLTRGHTHPIPTTAKDAVASSSEAAPSGNTSPGASVCSDVDIPYISYTLNRPIGDSPKMTGRGQSAGSAAKRGGFQQRRAAQRSASATSNSSAHRIVVVKEAKLPTSSDKDEDILRLQRIPMFLPIMRGTLGLPGARDPEVLEGIDSSSWIRLCGRYQKHLAVNAQRVSSEQNALTAKCKEVDAEVVKVHGTFVERQKSGAQLAEKLSHIKNISQQLTRCHATIEQLMLSAQELNDALPPEHRLEPLRFPSD